MLIDQQAHQFDYRDRRVCVVQLNYVFFVKALEAVIHLPEDADHILQGTGSQKILLLQTQFPPTCRFIVRIQNLGQVLGHHLGIDRAEPYVVYGFGDSLHDYGDVTYPQDILWCENCHEASATTPDGNDFSGG